MAATPFRPTNARPYKTTMNVRYTAEEVEEVEEEEQSSLIDLFRMFVHSPE